MHDGKLSHELIRVHSPPGPTGLRAVLAHRGVQVAAALWVIAYVLVLWLADGVLPFDRPAVAKFPFVTQLAAPSLTMIEI